MRTVDKFGHYRGILGKRGPPGVGFKLTPEGDYDMQNRSLMFVKDSQREHDAANYNGVKRCILAACPFANKDYSAFVCSNRQLSYVGEPAAENDAVTLGYLKRKALLMQDDSDNFNASSKRIKYVGTPIEATEAVNREYLETQLNAFEESSVKREYLESQLKWIDEDKVSREYFQKQVKEVTDGCLSLDKKENCYDAGLRRLSKLSDPLGKEDAVTLKFLRSWLKIQIYFIQQELTDMVINLRREIFNLHKQRPKPEDVRKHLNSIENHLDRTWRSALQKGPDVIKPMKTRLTPEERTKVINLLKVEGEHWDSFHEE